MRGETTPNKVELLMKQLGCSVRSPGSVFFTGGASAVLLGWREMTMDVDLKADPEPIGFFECLPRLKEELGINIEWASPDDFVPALPGWRERSLFIGQHGPLSFYHYDFYGQALAKIERMHARDRHDVRRMMECGLVKGDRLSELFLQIEAQLIRYPALDAEALRERVKAIATGTMKL
jgi:hypothetical protein